MESTWYKQSPNSRKPLMNIRGTTEISTTPEMSTLTPRGKGSRPAPKSGIKMPTMVPVTEDSSDQKHTASWIMYDLLRQIFLVAVAL